MTSAFRALVSASAPTAVVDLDVLDENAASMQRRAGGLPIRLASKSVRVRGLIERVLGMPGYHGVLGYSLSEAIWLVEHGADDVVIAYPTVDREGIARVAADQRLAEQITFMVDLPEHVDFLASVEGPYERRVAIDVDCSLRLGPVAIGAHRSRVNDPESATALAAHITQTEAVRLVGMMFYEAHVAGVPDDRFGMRLVKKLSNDQLATRRGQVRAAVEEFGPLEFVNGGGTGSLHTTHLDPTVTELAAGSGLFAPTSFDGFDDLRVQPAAFFASPVTRKPADDIVVTFSGGYLASGQPDKSRLPEPTHPPQLKYFTLEGAGEVQSPLRGPDARSLGLGDLVWFRHAKAGEMCERFNEVQLVSNGEVVDRIPTYRGEGKNFG